MYDVGDTLPVGELNPGAFLVAGPAMAGKYRLLIDLLVEGFGHDDAGLFVTTNESSDRVIDDVEAEVGRVPDHFRLVDCASEQQGVADRSEADRVELVSSPADLTGIGIGVSEQLNRFEMAGIERTRIGFYSLSTLMMYAEVETVFRFLHVLSGRIDNIRALGFFAIDPTAFEESAINTLKQVFDGMIEIREGESGREVRLVGIPNTPAEWVPRA